MQDTFARATHSAGRPSAARDDRVSCIQCEVQLASGNAIIVNIQDIQCQLSVSRGQILADKRTYKKLTNFVFCSPPFISQRDLLNGPSWKKF